mmetsp:Transcript_70430/g.223155  ORF Transcript_70430/g.223155 Transcript_70430/m.223155 type:complete len:379 (+) Transcript_70430:1509-2645(+)
MSLRKPYVSRESLSFSPERRLRSTISTISSGVAHLKRDLMLRSWPSMTSQMDFFASSLASSAAVASEGVGRSTICVSTTAASPSSRVHTTLPCWTSVIEWSSATTRARYPMVPSLRSYSLSHADVATPTSADLSGKVSCSTAPPSSDSTVNDPPASPIATTPTTSPPLVLRAGVTAAAPGISLETAGVASAVDMRRVRSAAAARTRSPRASAVRRAPFAPGAREAMEVSLMDADFLPKDITDRVAPAASRATALWSGASTTGSTGAEEVRTELASTTSPLSRVRRMAASPGVPSSSTVPRATISLPTLWMVWKVAPSTLPSTSAFQMTSPPAPVRTCTIPLTRIATSSSLSPSRSPTVIMLTSSGNVCGFPLGSGAEV